MKSQQSKIIDDSVRYFNRQSYDIFCEYEQTPTLYAVHIRPFTSVIKAIPYINRLEYVEKLVKRAIFKTQSYLIKHPRRPINQSRLIKSRNFVESHTKHNQPDIHHAHCVWQIHPELSEKFKSLTSPFNKSLINEYDKHRYLDREVFTFRDELLSPFKDEVRSIMLEEIDESDLENTLSYCSKHIDKASDLHSSSAF